MLTHGFTMDSKGMKMSKSLGNTINPLDLMRDYGADILRLWALSVDFTEDHRIGKEILAGVADQYRKLRNTFRYLLGALEGFEEAERVTDVAAMPELERYMLHLTAEMDAKLRQAVEDFDFNTYVRLLTDFANNDLSAFFFDIRKDSLYCDAPGDRKRRAYRSVLDTIVPRDGPLGRAGAGVHHRGSVGHALSRTRTGAFAGMAGSPGQSTARRCANGTKLRELRTAVTEAIEPLRRDKIVGSSLQAEVQLPEADVEPRPRRAVHHRASDEGRQADRDQDQFRKMRPLLAAFARSDPRRRLVRPLRGGGPWLSGAWRSGSRLLILIADQFTKWLVTGPLQLQSVRQIVLLPFFNLTWTENRGISLGLLHATSPTDALGAGGGDRGDRHRRRGVDHPRKARRRPARARAWCSAERSATSSTAAGFGYVVDFADLHFGDFRPFLVFNVADAAISIGVVILLLRAFLLRPERPEEKIEHA